MKYGVILEQADDGGWGAYVPELPGLGVVGDSREQALDLFVTAFVMHVDALVAMGEPLPVADAAHGSGVLVERSESGVALLLMAGPQQDANAAPSSIVCDSDAGYARSMWADASLRPLTAA